MSIPSNYDCGERILSDYNKMVGALPTRPTVTCAVCGMNAHQCTGWNGKPVGEYVCCTGPATCAACHTKSYDVQRGKVGTYHCTHAGECVSRMYDRLMGAPPEQLATAELIGKYNRYLAYSSGIDLAFGQLCHFLDYEREAVIIDPFHEEDGTTPCDPVAYYGEAFLKSAFLTTDFRTE